MNIYQAAKAVAEGRGWEMKITGMINVNNQLFVSTEDAVYRLYDGKLREVEFVHRKSDKEGK